MSQQCCANDPVAKQDTKAMWVSMFFGLFLVFSSFTLTLAPKAGSKVAVFTNPWATNGSAFTTIINANANVAATGNADWIAIAADKNPDLPSRLYKAGAALVIDAALLISCGILTSKYSKEK